MHFSIQGRLKQAGLVCGVSIFMCSLGVFSGASANALDNLQNSSTQVDIAHLVELKKKGVGNRQRANSVKTQSGDIAATVEQINSSLMGNSQRIGFTPNKRTTAISLEQQTALALLSKSTNKGGWQARFNPQSGAVAILRSAEHAATASSPRIADKGPIDALASAKLFLAENATLLKLEQFNDSLSLTSQSVDENASRHLRFNQHINGIPVWGKELLMHLNASGEIYQLNGDYLPDGPLPDTFSTIFEEDAIVATQRDLKADYLDNPTAELVYYSSDSQTPVLAWHVDARPALNRWYHYFIDAKNGEVIHRINNIHRTVEQSSGLDLFDKRQNFNSWLDDGTYFLLDPTFPLNNVTPQYDPVNDPNTKGDTVVIDAGFKESLDSLTYVISSSPTSGWDATAVTVMHTTRIVYDYYLENFGRKSLDDDNMNLVSVVHYGENYGNAHWTGQWMLYGDGDGSNFDSLAKCLDVAAHEMTHGVITHTANLIYENQSGALNESFADVFAALIDTEDWTIGEDCTIASPGYLRNLADPSKGLSKQPAKFSDYVNLPNTDEGDNGGVHINSGIPNHAFYLTANAIGHQKTGRIYYRALNVYLTASSQFIDAREALEQSATDLFGADSIELQAVSKAWDDVEVNESTTGPSGSTRPTVTDPVAGEDLMVYLQLQPRTSSQFDIYRQSMGNPFTSYDAANDVGPLNTVAARFTRPTVITASNGTFITYVGIDNNLYVINPGADARNDTMIGNGRVFTATFSPNGRYAAYTTNLANDDEIHIVDLTTAQAFDYPIILPSYQESGSANSVKVRFADSLNFDYTSEKLVFDVLLCSSLPNDDCDDSATSGYNYWGIGTLDIVNGGKFNFPFPSQSPEYSLGYPTFANNNNFISIMDVVFYNSSLEQFESGAFTYNYETQTLNPVLRLEPSKSELYTSPNFWGDDNYATFAFPDLEAGKYTAARVSVSEASDWTGTGSAIELNPNFAGIPTMHRAGVRDVNRSLSVSSNSLDFGSINEGESKLLNLTLSNIGNSDVDINNVTLSSNRFSHNATNKRLPRGESTIIQVQFTPGGAKNYTANLIINSTGTPNSLSITLRGSNSNGSSGSGGIGSPWALLVLMLFRLRFNATTKQQLK